MFQSLDDQFRECEVLRKDPSTILTSEKHRYVIYPKVKKLRYRNKVFSDFERLLPTEV